MTAPSAAIGQGRRPQETSQHKPERVLDDRSKDQRRHQRGEDTTEHAANGDPQVEVRQLIGRRSIRCELTVTDQRRDGEGE